MAKAIISTNSDVADSTPMSVQEQILKNLDTDYQTRSKGAYSTKQNIIVPVSYNFRAQGAFEQTGGSVYPTSPDQFVQAPFAPIDPAIRKLSNVNTLQYTYDLSFFEGFRGSTYTPTDFTAPIYITIGYANPNYFYNFLIDGDTTNDKFVLLNSFQVGNLVFSASFGGRFKMENLAGSQRVRERVDWTIPIEERPIISSSGGIDFTDFENFNPKKITNNQKQEILAGNYSQIAVSFCVQLDNLSTTNQNFFLTDVVGEGAMTFVSSLSFEYYGLGTAYSPII